MQQALPLTPYSTLDEQVTAMEEDGYSYLPRVINSEQLTELRDAMDRLTAIPESFDRHSVPQNGEGFLNKHINNAFNRDLVFLQYLDMSPVIELAEAVHGEDCHVIGMTAWITGPGRPDQGLHTDWLPISIPADVLADARVKVPIFITTAHYYLDNLYEELGPTKFVPGSHLSGCRPDGETRWKGAEEQSILCKAGDVVLFRSEVWHRGTANRSQQTRYLLQVHYANRMITQKFPPYLNRFQFNDAILEQSTERQMRLLGNHRPGAYD